MDIEKLIEELNDFNENHIAVLCGSGQCACGYLCDKDDCIVVQAATAITDLLVENQSLRNAANGFKARAEAAEDMAEKAERERDEAVESICMRCSVLPCRKNGCYWYRFKKEE